MNKILRFLPKYLRGIAYSIHLFTVGVFRNEHRRLIYDICHFYKWRQNGVTPRVPIENIEHIFSSPLSTRILEPSFTPGNVTLAELSVIIYLTATIKPSTIFEIGTFDGRTTLNLAANASSAKIWTLDLPAEQITATRFSIASGEEDFIKKAMSGERFVGTEYEDQIIQIYGDSASYNYQDFEKAIDLVFIDGSHSYEYAVSDTEVALSLIRPGGVIIWHDYDNEAWPGVTKALNEHYAQGGIFESLRHISGTTLAYLRT